MNRESLLARRAARRGKSDMEVRKESIVNSWGRLERFRLAEHVEGMVNATVLSEVIVCLNREELENCKGGRELAAHFLLNDEDFCLSSEDWRVFFENKCVTNPEHLYREGILGVTRAGQLILASMSPSAGMIGPLFFLGIREAKLGAEAMQKLMDERESSDELWFKAQQVGVPLIGGNQSVYVGLVKEIVSRVKENVIQTTASYLSGKVSSEELSEIIAQLQQL